MSSVWNWRAQVQGIKLTNCWTSFHTFALHPLSGWLSGQIAEVLREEKMKERDYQVPLWAFNSRNCEGGCTCDTEHLPCSIKIQKAATTNRLNNICRQGLILILLSSSFAFCCLSNSSPHISFQSHSPSYMVESQQARLREAKDLIIQEVGETQESSERERSREFGAGVGRANPKDDWFS